MMEMFLKLKKEMKSENLSNKEAMRRMLKKMGETAEGMMVKKTKPRPQAKRRQDFPGDFPVNSHLSRKTSEIFDEKTQENEVKVTRHIPIAIKREAIANSNNLCSHPNCHNPIQIFHHQVRFSQTPNHSTLIPLCKLHHEFAHNGITEPQTEADRLYIKYRQKALL
jgi:hypothetical protein